MHVSYIHIYRIFLTFIAIIAISCCIPLFYDISVLVYFYITHFHPQKQSQTNSKIYSTKNKMWQNNDAESAADKKRIFMICHVISSPNEIQIVFQFRFKRGSNTFDQWMKLNLCLFVFTNFISSFLKEDANRGKPNWEHLSDELHVLITVEDTENRAHIKLERAVEEVKKLLVPVRIISSFCLDSFHTLYEILRLFEMIFFILCLCAYQQQAEGEDELKKRQLMELAIINGTYRDSSMKISSTGKF